MRVINQYYKRHIEDIIKRSFDNNKVVSILGARQVCKATVVEYLFNSMNSVALKTEFLISQANQNLDHF